MRAAINFDGFQVPRTAMAIPKSQPSTRIHCECFFIHGHKQSCTRPHKFNARSSTVILLSNAYTFHTSKREIFRWKYVRFRDLFGDFIYERQRKVAALGCTHTVYDYPTRFLRAHRHRCAVSSLNLQNKTRNFSHWEIDLMFLPAMGEAYSFVVIYTKGKYGAGV